MTGRRPPGLLRGSELTTLLTLLGLVVVVLAMIINSRRAAPPNRPNPPTASELPALPPPDSAPEFEGLQDRTELRLRDTAAFKLLVERVRETPPQQLARNARRELVFSQFFDDPSRYRGLPIRVEGRALRVLVQSVEPDSTIFPSGRFFEIYVTTPDSQRNPYLLVSEEVPPGLAIGDGIDVPVVFAGYFLKLMAYESGDGRYRATPLIVGRILDVTEMGSPGGGNFVGPGMGRGWLLYIGMTLGGLLLLRLGLAISRSFTATRARPYSQRSVVTDQIEPAELSAWIEREQGNPHDDDDASESRPWPA